MAGFAFKQVDVFTRTPYRGNPVAVVLGAATLHSEQMQAIAAWTNLSETTFVLPPASSAADYRLRIFTPTGELPFAGHPTVGSAHAVLEAGVVSPGADRLRQECGAGILDLTVEGTGEERQIFTAVPAVTFGRHCGDLVDRLSAALGGAVTARPEPQVVDVGPVWLIAQIAGLGAIERLRPDPAALAALSRELNLTGVTVFELRDGEDSAVRVRSFAPLVGVNEDPVCGSGNACIAAFLARSGLLSHTGSAYLASQGCELGRDGRVAVRVHDQGARIEIGGSAVTLIDGRLAAPLRNSAAALQT